MTLERDDMRLAEADATQADLETSSPATAEELDQMTDEEAAEAIEIRSEIEVTRVEMGGTLSELGDRLEPGHLVNQAKENVREATIGRVEDTAKGMSDMVMETIKRNPIPAALAGAGLAMLWANRSGSNGHDGRSIERRYDAYYGGNASYGQRGMGDRVGETASKVGDNVGRVAGDVGQNVSRTVGDVGENVGQGIGQVGGQLDRFMQASPLAMGAIAMGAGALIGAILPETQQEREMLSDAGRQVGNVVRDAVDQATTKAEEAMDTAEDKVTSGASS